MTQATRAADGAAPDPRPGRPPRDPSPSPARRLRDCASGGAAVGFGLALIPMMAAGGIALDYARGQATRTAMAAAADAAALSSARALLNGTPPGQAKKIGEDHARAMLASQGIQKLDVRAAQKNGGMRVEIDGEVRTSVLAVVGRKTIALGVAAEANTDLGPGMELGTEIALALDVTGSMANDMAAMRAAAAGFLDLVMEGTTKVSVVPFVAAVNVGPGNIAMASMDANADARWHASRFKGLPIGNSSKCVFTPTSGGGGPYVPPNPGVGKSGSLAVPAPNRFAAIGAELLGITPAQAQTAPMVTPPTKPIVPGAKTTITDPAAPPGTQVFVPQGWTLNGCALFTPPKVSNFDLFARIPGAKWKGCVEARPEPYDVTDEPPSKASPDTLFVPYFAPDEPGTGADPATSLFNGYRRYNNDYLPDMTYYADGTLNKAGPTVTGPSDTVNFYWDNSNILNILKYDGTTAPVPLGLKETPPVTYGPNRACPDELLRLTTDKAKAKAKVAGLSHWAGGGTIGSEGVAWAWRTLSPSAPFADGAAYGPKTKKAIVLLTDGLNLMDANGRDASPFVGSATYTDWTAYGYLREHWGRLGNGTPETFDGATDYLNARMKLVCANAKAKGVTVYAILFRETDPRAVDTVKGCASENAFFYYASNQNELKNAFEAIGNKFAKTLRLTK